MLGWALKVDRGALKSVALFKQESCRAVVCVGRIGNGLGASNPQVASYCSHIYLAGLAGPHKGANHNGMVWYHIDTCAVHGRHNHAIAALNILNAALKKHLL